MEISKFKQTQSQCSLKLIMNYHHHHHHQSVLPKGRSFTAKSGTKVAVLLRMNRCGNFPLLSAPHSLFSICTDLKRSEKIPGAPREGKDLANWPSGLHRNSPQGLNNSFIRVFDKIRDPEIPITLRPQKTINGR